MTDTLTPLAYRGRGILGWPFTYEFAESEPAASIALVSHRYFACLFGAPLWGCLFDGENDGSSDRDRNPS